MKIRQLVESYGNDIDLSNEKLTKLPNDLPDKILGTFRCQLNNLTSLKGCPSVIGGHFHCFDNWLTSLEGCPSQVDKTFWCNDNKLTSLEGCPSHISDDFCCYNNELTSLEYGPSKVDGNFWCHGNLLTSLGGCPSYIGGSFWCHNNQLMSFEGCPSYIGDNFWCHGNLLTSLHDIHKWITKIGKDFYCLNNPIESHILGLMMIEIGGEIRTELGNGTDVDRILNKWKNQGRRGVMGAMKELSDLGYEELAQL